MFGIGSTELIILLAILVLLFGSSKLPQLGSGIGEAIRNFKKSMKEPDAIDVTPNKAEASGAHTKTENIKKDGTA